MITEVRLQQEGANDSSAVVTGWSVDDGQPVVAGEPVVEMETSKVVVEIAAPHDGFVVRAVPLGHEADVGDVLAYVCEKDDELDDARNRCQTNRPPSSQGGDVGSDDGQRFSLAALEYVAAHSVPRERFDDLSLVTLRDVKDREGARNATAGEPVPRAKSLEIDRLTRANVLNAALTVQMDGSAIREWAASAAVPSIQLLAAVVHAVGRSLARFPNLNSWFEDGIHCHQAVGVGVAVDLDDGLKVGVVRDADSLDPDSIRHRIDAIVTRYVNQTLGIEDVSGSTVTVSDLSVEDVLTFQPLLNYQQALAVGVGGDASLPGAPLTLTATFDHRVSTGREVSSFLAECRRIMTDLAERM